MGLGLREDAASSIGTVFLTGTGPGGAAGTSGGIPCRGSWPDIDDHDPAPGGVVQAIDGTPAVQSLPRGEIGREVTIRLAWFERALYDALVALWASADTALALVLRHRAGTYSATVKPRRPRWLAAPNGEHPWTGTRGRELEIRLVVAAGGTWS